MADDVDEYNRDERIEAMYQGWGAREMAERIVQLEDELGADVDGICTGMHADVAEAHAEIERLTRALRLSEAKVGGAALYVDQVNAKVAMLENVVVAYDGIHEERDRYRLAWLSARRRAVVESNHGDEAMDYMRGQAAQLTAQRDRLRAFADEVAHVRGWCMDAATAGDLMASHLRPVYEALYELEKATREGRPFVPRPERRTPQVD
jgi:hypothetical protein